MGLVGILKKEQDGKSPFAKNKPIGSNWGDISTVIIS